MLKPTLFVLSQPHTQVSSSYSRCAYTTKVLHFCQMMVKEGYEVFLLASEDNETSATLLTCITKKELSKLGFNGPEDYLKNDFDNTKPLWQIFHQHAIYEIGKRIKNGDIICTFSGRADLPVSTAFPDAYFVETGVGYSGVCANYRVYESYSWMHTIYGALSGDASRADGRFYDTVIPNYFDPNDFPLVENKKDYFLFVGRMIHRKGIKIIEEMARRMPDTKFIMAGQGGKQEKGKIVCNECTLVGDNLEYIGTIDVEQRGKLMSEARALIVPTLYVGPFEGVHVEAMLCGTPVITTDFGVFTETVTPEVGIRCSIIKDFVQACSDVSKLEPKRIREYAVSRFSMDAVGPMYTKYLERIKGLERGGFYE